MPKPSTPKAIVEAWARGLTEKARQYLSLYDLFKLEAMIEAAGPSPAAEPEPEPEVPVVTLDQSVVDEPTHKAQTIEPNEQLDLKMLCPANSLVRVSFELGGPQHSNLPYQQIECRSFDVEESRYIDKPLPLEDLPSATQLMLMDTGTGFENVHDPLKTHDVSVRLSVRNTKNYQLRVHLQVVSTKAG